MLGVPLLREGQIRSARSCLSAASRGQFTHKQIELVQTFADQAVIAIENVRLFDEIQDKSRQLADGEPAQVAVPRQHEPRAAHAAQRHPRLHRADRRRHLRRDAGEGAATCSSACRSNGKHLLGLINDVLDLSKIEAGQLKLSLERLFDRRTSCTACLRRVEPLASEKKLALQGRGRARPAAGHGDERRLTQVLLNLVGNAIKFTDAGEVAIKAPRERRRIRRRGARHRARASPRPTRTSMFEEFQQADNSITKQKGGTGLGLAISQAHHRDARRQHLASSRSSARARPSPSRCRSRSKQQSEASMSKRILVVEDQEDNRQILRDLLDSAGYEMIEARRRRRRRSPAVAKQRPDLILMDIQLPDHGRLRGDAPHQGRSRRCKRSRSSP